MKNEKPKYYSVIRLPSGKYKREHQFCQFRPGCVEDFKIWCRKNLDRLYKKYGKENISVREYLTSKNGIVYLILNQAFWSPMMKWAEAKKLIDYQFNKFNRMIFALSEDPSEFISGNSWIKCPEWWWKIETKFCTVEFDKNTQTVIVSHVSTESPNDGYICVKHWIPIAKISALSSILMSAYLVKKARNLLED